MRHPRPRPTRPLDRACSFTTILRAASQEGTAATLALGEGVHPKVVQEMLDHLQIAITLDTYSHLLPTMQKEAAAKMDALFANLGR